jgi:hypothetical protein
LLAGVKKMEDKRTEDKKPYTQTDAFLDVGKDGLIFLALISIPTFNVYFKTDEVLLKDLQSHYPEVEVILRTERNIWACSTILAQKKDGRELYHLNTDILFNYSFNGDACY